jgi:hypothetical protein
MKVALLPQTATVPLTAVPPTTLASLKVEVVTVEGVMASANVAVTAAFNAMAVAPLLGEVEDTVGGLPSATPDAGPPVEEPPPDPPPPPQPASPDNTNAAAIKSAKRFPETANRRVDIEVGINPASNEMALFAAAKLEGRGTPYARREARQTRSFFPRSRNADFIFEGAYRNGCASDELLQTLSQLANASRKLPGSNHAEPSPTSDPFLMTNSGMTIHAKRGREKSRAASRRAQKWRCATGRCAKIATAATTAAEGMDSEKRRAEVSDRVTVYFVYRTRHIRRTRNRFDRPA